MPADLDRLTDLATDRFVSDPDAYHLLAEAIDELRERREAQDDIGESEARVEALEEAAATLIGALTEYGETPWWLRAAHSLDELKRLAVDQDGV
jgi:predicted Zn-dependent protease